MKTRLITSAVIVAIFLPLLIFSEFITYPIALALLAFIAVYEVLKAIGTHKNFFVAIPAYLLGAALPFSAYFASDIYLYLLILAALIFSFLIYIMGVGVFSKGKLPFAIMSEAFVMVAYVVVSFSSMALIRYIDMQAGKYLIFLVFIAAWCSDSCAYLTGYFFGKHKLIPEVSPKKTVEGAVGGVVGATLAYGLYGFVVSLIEPSVEVNYIALAVFGFVLAIVSQIGDLVASLLKREHGIKDYGKLFPGHGGVMDRFDSIFAVSTILLILCLIFPPFVF